MQLPFVGNSSPSEVAYLLGSTRYPCFYSRFQVSPVALLEHVGSVKEAIGARSSCQWRMIGGKVNILCLIKPYQG